MLNYRPYQSDIVEAIQSAWAAGHQNVLAVQATRTGKTVVFSGILATMVEASVAIAHRQELIGQMSLALAKCGVLHRIIAPPAVIKQIIRRHVHETGTSWHDARAPCGVASLKSLLSQKAALARWISQIKLWVVDEGHHLLDNNEWGKVIALFPTARGLGVTATAKRADGKGLGRATDGVYDEMVIGMQALEAIEEGWLLSSKIYAPISDYHRPDDSKIGKTGDFTKNAVSESVRNSHIVGDVVVEYTRYASGKSAVVFAPDVETGRDMSTQFNKAGIRAELVNATTPIGLRMSIMSQFEKKEVLVLINVDLYGEGTDLPDVDVVIQARPTESFGLFVQQTARPSTVSLPFPLPETREARLAAIAASAKPCAIIIDHVGNVVRHGVAVERNGETVIALAHAQWSLDRRDKRARDKPTDAIPLRACLNPSCMQVYERVLPVCPYCGHHPVPASRSAPEFVDGDLTELDAETLAAMRGEVETLDMPVVDYRAEMAAKRVPPIGQEANAKRHLAKQDAQSTLRDAMAWWAGHHKAAGRSDAESYRRFYHQFKIDALSAQALGVTEAQDLTCRILAEGAMRK